MNFASLLCQTSLLLMISMRLIESQEEANPESGSQEEANPESEDDGLCEYSDDDYDESEERNSTIVSTIRCCPGYREYIVDLVTSENKTCQRICPPTGYNYDENIKECVPICSPVCHDSVCVAPNQPKMIKDFDRGFCNVTDCVNGCKTNATTCICFGGFKKFNRTVCQPDYKMLPIGFCSLAIDESDTERLDNLNLNIRYETRNWSIKVESPNSAHNCINRYFPDTCGGHAEQTVDCQLNLSKQNPVKASLLCSLNTINVESIISKNICNGTFLYRRLTDNKLVLVFGFSSTDHLMIMRPIEEYLKEKRKSNCSYFASKYISAYNISGVTISTHILPVEDEDVRIELELTHKRGKHMEMYGRLLMTLLVMLILACLTFSFCYRDSNYKFVWKKIVTSNQTANYNGKSTPTKSEEESKTLLVSNAVDVTTSTLPSNRGDVKSITVVVKRAGEQKLTISRKNECSKAKDIYHSRRALTCSDSDSSVGSDAC